MMGLNTFINENKNNTKANYLCINPLRKIVERFKEIQTKHAAFSEIMGNIVRFDLHFFVPGKHLQKYVKEGILHALTKSNTSSLHVSACYIYLCGKLSHIIGEKSVFTLK